MNINAWRQGYNRVRPHGAIDNRVPMDFLKPTHQPWLMGPNNRVSNFSSAPNSGWRAGTRLRRGSSASASASASAAAGSGSSVAPPNPCWVDRTARSEVGSGTVHALGPTTFNRRGSDLLGRATMPLLVLRLARSHPSPPSRLPDRHRSHRAAKPAVSSFRRPGG